MFGVGSCRMCSDSPFSLFGGGEEQPKEKKSTKEKSKKKTVKPCVKRSEEELQNLVKQWEQYVHPRAKEFFPTSEMVESVLMQIAKGIHKDDDPVLGEDGVCVPWYGDVTKDDQQAAIRMVKPGETIESVTYVNRVLAFIFATDDSFEQLMRLPKEPFKMSCGDQLCVNLAHISLQVYKDEQ